MDHKSKPHETVEHTVTFTREEVKEILITYARNLYRTAAPIGGSGDLIIPVDYDDDERITLKFITK